MASKLAIIGNISLDHVTLDSLPNSTYMFIGGAALNIGAAYSVFGDRPRLHCYIGQNVIDVVNYSNQLDISLCEYGTPPSPEFFIHYDREFSIRDLHCNNNDSCGKINISTAADAIDKTSFIHFSLRTPYSVTDLERIISTGCRISIDVIISSIHIFAKILVDVIGDIELLFCNSREWGALCEQISPYKIPCAIVTDGPGPISVWRYGLCSRRYTVQECSIVEPTGAGDSFIGGFLSGLLHDLTEEESIRRGSRCARIALTHPGVVHIIGKSLDDR